MLDVIPVPLSTGNVMYPAVEFASIDGFRPLQLDLYCPEPSDRPAPAIVYLHGGGWTVGTRRRFGRSFRSWSPTPLARLAADGFVVATVDYRLSGEAIFPAQLDDALAAVRWVRTHAAELGVDPDRIMAWGESAGGHLAALVGLRGRRDTGDDVCGVIDWYGPMDLRQAHDPDSFDVKALGGTAADQPERAVDASPILHVHPAAPPFLIWHGTADTLVSISHGEQMAAALEAAGVPVDFVAVEGAEHFWTDAPDLEAVFVAARDFAIRITSC